MCLFSVAGTSGAPVPVRSPFAPGWLLRRRGGLPAVSPRPPDASLPLSSCLEFWFCVLDLEDVLSARSSGSDTVFEASVF